MYIYRERRYKCVWRTRIQIQSPHWIRSPGEKHIPVLYSYPYWIELTNPIVPSLPHWTRHHDFILIEDICWTAAMSWIPYTRKWDTRKWELRYILCSCPNLRIVLVLLSKSTRSTFPLTLARIDWCCYYFCIKKCLVALLEALFTRIFLDSMSQCNCFWQRYSLKCLNSLWFCKSDPNDRTVKVKTYLKSPNFFASNGEYYNSLRSFWMF